ncbi:MAG: glutamate synthase central domain-containing protein [Gallintestinimicrobium sp.]
MTMRFAGIVRCVQMGIFTIQSYRGSQIFEAVTFRRRSSMRILLEPSAGSAVLP